MTDLIAELLVTEAGIEKLGARGISIDEAERSDGNRQRQLDGSEGAISRP